VSKKVNKLETEEYDKIVDFQNKIRTMLQNIGVLESQKHAILHDIAGINEDQEKLKKEIEDKYGAININLGDGSYEAIKENVE
jgi:predicted  nucleic acid-binding Zn-ribbon protein|tara:strand:- start:71 stop:319 length:249 start_codon:yes stop_codon:yes gene_type:complete